MAALTLFGLSAASCNEPNYRTEVTPTGQGTVDIKQVPLDHPPTPPPQPDAAAQVTQSLTETDADFATVQSLWPKLSAADHKTVSDLVRRLAASQPQ
ncbi:MAG: hypothetical protein ABSH22_17385 [Tepidisphaeraceae bacterium]|jgi:hypothetical protein